MVSTIVCARCGTRNRVSLERCRRCKGELIETSHDSGMTVRGTPTSALLANRWAVLGPLPAATGEGLVLGQEAATQTRVVIAKLSEKASGDAVVRQRFLHDARRLAQIRSPYVNTVVDVVDEPDAVAVVFERYQGKSLNTILAERGRLPLSIVVELGRQILEGLQALQSVELAHRRLRPEKVLITSGKNDGLLQAVLVGIDLPGTSHVALGESTHRGTLVGMRQDDVAAEQMRDIYQAPETEGGATAVQADIYSLGTILLEALVGSVPESLVFARGARVSSAIRAALGQWYDDLAAEAITATVLRMMTTNLAERHRTLAHARADLDGLVEACPRDIMYPVPAGTFLRGSRADDPMAREEETPQRLLELGGFYIDRTAVTASQYKTFLDATGKEAAPGWTDYNDPERAPHRPVVFVNWHEARAYAIWAGKTLPTEAQWEKAARGVDGRIYPWGDQNPEPALAWFDQKEEPCDVGRFPAGASPYGLLDMAGNAFEWVQDWFDREYYQAAPVADPPGPEAGAKKVLRGGSFVHNVFALRCATRGRYAPEERRANHSFRCVWSLQR